MPTKTLSLGGSGAAIEQLQSQLWQLGFTLPTSELDHGQFSQAMQVAVKKHQEDNGLPVTGQVTAKTAATLATLAAPLLASVSPVPWRRGHRVLRTRSKVGNSQTDALGAYPLVHPRPAWPNLPVLAIGASEAVSSEE